MQRARVAKEYEMLSRHEAGRLQGLTIVRLSRSAFANQPAKAAAVTERSKRGVAAKAVVFLASQGRVANSFCSG